VLFGGTRCPSVIADPRPVAPGGEGLPYAGITPAGHLRGLSAIVSPPKAVEDHEVIGVGGAAPLVAKPG
jgi:hypothetical protein